MARIFVCTQIHDIGQDVQKGARRKRHTAQVDSVHVCEASPRVIDLCLGGVDVA